MKHSVAILLVAISISTLLPAQKPILQRSVTPFPNKSQYGPNRTHFVHPILQAQMGVPQLMKNSGSPSYLSGAFSAGIRYKMKILPVIAMGLESGFFFEQGRQGNDLQIILPDSLAAGKNSISSTGFYTGTFVRFRLGQRGDYLGRYVDIGIAGKVPLQTVAMVRCTRPKGNSPQPLSKATVYQRIDPIRSFDTFLFLRLGIDRIAITLYSGKSEFFPVIHIGLEYAPVRY